MSLSTIQPRLRPFSQVLVRELLSRRAARLSPVSPVAPVRGVKMFPASQYDTPPSKRFTLGHVLCVHWEIAPLFLVVSFAMGLIAFATYWAVENKVDVQWRPPSTKNISHTMDLRHPTVHKLFIINQKYEPWPEMQNALDKMKEKEYDVSRRPDRPVQACSFAATAIPVQAL